MKKMKNETMNAVRLISVIFLPNLDVSVDTIFLKRKDWIIKKGNLWDGYLKITRTWCTILIFY